MSPAMDGKTESLEIEVWLVAERGEFGRAEMEEGGGVGADDKMGRRGERGGKQQQPTCCSPGLRSAGAKSG